jgi:high-affinity iron transporter
VFFICFRECVECVIIVSILLAFLKQTIGGEADKTVYKKLLWQIWGGVAAGIFICLCVGGGMIGAFYALNQDVFSNAENLWEGIFGIIASLIISVVGIGLLRVNKLQDKWRIKVAKALEKTPSNVKLTFGGRLKRWGEKYCMFLLPFVTVLREGLEAMVFIGGVGLGLPATSFPLAVVCGLGAGLAIGYLIYK